MFIRGGLAQKTVLGWALGGAGDFSRQTRGPLSRGGGHVQASEARISIRMLRGRKVRSGRQDHDSHHYFISSNLRYHTL